MLGKPLSILKPPSLPNHRYKPGFENSRHHNLRLSSLLESRFRRIIILCSLYKPFLLNFIFSLLLPTWLHIRPSFLYLAFMNCFQVCYLNRSQYLMVLIIILAHLLRPENEYNRHRDKYQEVCLSGSNLFDFLIIVFSVPIHPVLDAHRTRLHRECYKAARILITPKVSHMILVSMNPILGLMLLTIENVQRHRSILSMSSDLTP